MFFFFDICQRFKFGTFCSYWQEENIEIQLRKEIAKLKAGINKLICKKRKLLTGQRVPEETSKLYQHSVEIEENIEIPNSDIPQNNSSALINVYLQILKREISGYQCDLYDFRTKTEKVIRIHKGKMHTKTMETQTEKFNQSLVDLQFLSHSDGKERELKTANHGI